MVNLQTIHVINIAAILVCVLLFCNSLHTIVFKESSYKIFLCMLLVCIFQACWYITSYVWDINGYFGSYYLGTISSSVLFIANAVFELLWLVYIQSRLLDDWKWNGKRTVIASIPAMLIIIGSIVNIFIPVFFEIDPVTIVYKRTVLFSIAQLAPIFYFGYGMYLSYMAAKNKTQIQFFPVFRFMLPIVIAIVLETCFYGLTFVPFACAFALASLFINIIKQGLFVDLLSGLYNRTHLAKYLQSVTVKKPSSKVLVGIMLDIDRFKYINDTFGHIVGDDAIREMGRLIRRAMDREALGFRYAGDEFVILHIADDEQEALRNVSRLKEQAEKFNKEKTTQYSLDFSYGYTVFDYTTDTIDSFVAQMDKNMYIDKYRKKANNPEQTPKREDKQ